MASRAERRWAEREARRLGGHLVEIHPDGSVELCFGGPGDGCTDRMAGRSARDGVPSTAPATGPRSGSWALGGA